MKDIEALNLVLGGELLIHIENLSKNFGEKVVLDNIDLQIRKGEIFGIIGDSGSGKSTLLRCINGLIPIDNGNITIEDVDISTLNEGELNRFRQNIGMIFQSFSLVNRLSVYDNIALPLKILGVNKKIIKEKILNITNLIGISDKLNNKPRELSGGQKQRVAIARALITTPKLILSDESTSALDPETSEEILSLFLNLNAEFGITIIMVSHEMDVIQKTCDRMAKIKEGSIVATGTPQYFFLEEQFNIQHKKSNKLLIAANLIEQSTFLSQLSKITTNDISLLNSKTYHFKNNKLNEIIISLDKDDVDSAVNYLKSSSLKWRYIN